MTTKIVNHAQIQATPIIEDISGSTLSGPPLDTSTKLVLSAKSFTSFASVAPDYTIRYEVYQGKKHLVVPVVMMVEGVHSGSSGPQFHSAEELGKFPAAWNDIPITVQHPTTDGEFVSAKTPGMIEVAVVGPVYNTFMDDKRLRAEAWLEEDKIKEVSPLALAYILQQKPLEVSVGVFTDDILTGGIWNGEAYNISAINHRPDHLALLPGGKGACSWEDGAGIRVNEDGTGVDSVGVKINEKGGQEVVLKDIINQVQEKGFMVNLSETGFQDIISAIQKQLDTLDNTERQHYIREVFSDSFVYEVVKTNGGPVQMYKRKYTIGDDAVVAMADEFVEVSRKVEYPEIKGLSAHENKKEKGGNEMKEKIDGLLTMAGSPFVEADRAKLEVFGEEVIDKMIAFGVHEEVAGDVKIEPTPQMNEETAAKILQESLADPVKLMSLLPNEVAGQIQHGLKLHADHRQSLIDRVIANQAGEVWKKEDLDLMSTDNLQKTADSIKKPVSYVANASGSLGVNSEEVLLPAGVQEKEE